MRLKRPKIIKNYVSEVDQFLQAFDQQHIERSQSQREEQKKMKRIAELRDKKQTKN